MDSMAEIFGALEGGGDSVGLTASAVPSPSVSDAMDAERSSPVPTTSAMCRLAAYVTQAFIENCDARRRAGIDEKLRDALLAQTCRYTPRQEEKLQKAGIDPKVYTPITATKVRAAKAMLMDIFQSTDEWPFTLSPTPDPELPKAIEAEAYRSTAAEIEAAFAEFARQGLEELPPDMMMRLEEMAKSSAESAYDAAANKRDQFARRRARRMERKVQDIMAEGGWVDAFNEYVDYICTYGTGLILGPIPRVMPVNRCHENPRTGSVRYTREYKLIPTFEAVNPCDCYPAADAKSVEDGPLCIRVKYVPNELRAYCDAAANKASRHGAEGWNPATMNSLLAKWPRGGCKVWPEQRDQVIREAENKSVDDSRDCTLEGIRCFASIRGSDLIDFGITKTRDGAEIKYGDYYSTETIVIDGFVVYCRIIDDRLGRPVSKGVFYEVPGSWWGESIASKCHMVQSVMNNAIKALLQNMAVASGPMYYINDVSRLVDKSPEGLKFRPHKVLPFTGSMGGTSSAAPVGVITAPSNASELLAVFNAMKTQAEEDSGIPAYAYGQSSGQGALRTSSGLAILTEAMSRGMKMVIGVTDRLVTRDQVKKVCNWILLFDSDLNLKGDCEVHPAGVMGKILKAQQDQQRLQFLNMAITNPTLQQLFGPRGIVALLRPSIKDLAINPDDCLPSDEKLAEMELIQQIQQITQATQAQQQEPAPEEQGEGAPPGVAQPPQVQGGVAERRSVA